MVRSNIPLGLEDRLDENLSDPYPNLSTTIFGPFLRLLALLAALALGLGWHTRLLGFGCGLGLLATFGHVVSPFLRMVPPRVTVRCVGLSPWGFMVELTGTDPVS